MLREARVLEGGQDALIRRRVGQLGGHRRPSKSDPSATSSTPQRSATYGVLGDPQQWRVGVVAVRAQRPDVEVEPDESTARAAIASCCSSARLRL